MGTTIAEVAHTLETWAPVATAESYDNVGLQVGRGNTAVTGGVIALDLTPQVISEAGASGANLIVTHHPLFFRPIKSITSDTLVGSMALEMVEMGIAHYAIHTNLDAARNGVSFALARQLGLLNVEFLIAPDLDDGDQTGIGTIGDLEEPMSLEAFLTGVSSALGNPSLKHTGNTSATVKRVAVCGGSGSSFLAEAVRQGADAYVTGDVKYHQFFDALASDGTPLIAFIDAGHYETEAPTEELLLEHLLARHPEIRWTRTQCRTSPIHAFISEG